MKRYTGGRSYRIGSRISGLKARRMMRKYKTNNRYRGAFKRMSYHKYKR